MIPVVIPSYEPDNKLIILIKDLLSNNLKPIIVVNDGSSSSYDEIFNEVRELIKDDGVIITHKDNFGKGKALKNAFKYILKNYLDVVGCVTIDSDGQHSINSINKCMTCFKDNNNCLVLGVRNFDLDNVPERSKFGNKLTRNIFKKIYKLNISDTQTGLRVIPINFMRQIINLPGDRFEYETQMLIETKNRVEIKEVKISTIYDSKDNHKTHFNTIEDSYRIYSVFIKYLFKKR